MRGRRFSVLLVLVIMLWHQNTRVSIIPAYFVASCQKIIQISKGNAVTMDGSLRYLSHGVSK